MYNRYIGNTGKFYRIDDDNLPARDARQYPVSQPQPQAAASSFYPADHSSKSQSPFPFSFSQQELIGSLKGMLSNFLPEGMDLGDLLLILVLLLLYLEKEDEEILIILSVLIFSGFK